MGQLEQQAKRLCWPTLLSKARILTTLSCTYSRSSNTLLSFCCTASNHQPPIRRRRPDVPTFSSKSSILRSISRMGLSRPLK